MRTATDIANMTCDFLDADPIGNIETDRSGMGKALRRNYDEAVATVIREFSWNCTITRSKLNKLELPEGFTVDGTDHQTAWALPANSLGVIDVNGRPYCETSHAIETIAIYDGNGAEISAREVMWCDEDQVILRHKRLIKASDMDPHLAKAVAIELGLRCVMKATNSTQKAGQLESMYKDATRGSSSRVGGHQASSRENNAKRPRALMSTGGAARAGSI